jgi:hypothetical protein
MAGQGKVKKTSEVLANFGSLGRVPGCAYRAGLLIQKYGKKITPLPRRTRMV